MICLIIGKKRSEAPIHVDACGEKHAVGNRDAQVCKACALDIQAHNSCDALRLGVSKMQAVSQVSSILFDL